MEKTDHEPGTRCLVVEAHWDAFGGDCGLTAGFLAGGEYNASVRGRKDGCCGAPQSFTLPSQMGQLQLVFLVSLQCCWALALGAFLHDFAAPWPTQKLFFFTKRELWSKNHIAFLYSAPREVLQLLQPKYVFAGNTDPHVAGAHTVKAQLGEEQLAKMSTSERLPWESKGHV